MRALIFDGQLRLDTAAVEPRRAADQALLKIRRAGICNTDLELIAGMYGFSGILGHEFVAEVVEGDALLVGKRVCGEINVACERCDMCRRDIPSQCRTRVSVGIKNHPGCFADYLALVMRNLHVVPDQVSDDQAVFVEPLASALQMLHTAHISPRDRVVVLGAGKLGMLVAQVLKLAGAALEVVIRREKQARVLTHWNIPAVSFGEVIPHSAQVVVDCTGQAEGFRDALDLVEPRGKILLKSTFFGLPQVDLSQVAVRELQVIGSRCGPFDAALRLLEAGLVDVEPLIEARYNFSDAVQAVGHAGKAGVFKVLLDF